LIDWSNYCKGCASHKNPSNVFVVDQRGLIATDLRRLLVRIAPRRHFGA
jgi:hypothetical protein